MRAELILGVVGGILGIIFTLIGYFVFGLIEYMVGMVAEVEFLASLFWWALFGSMLGIVGGAISGKPKICGVIMLVGAILVLISLMGGFQFYFLNIIPFIMLLVGSMLAFRAIASEKRKGCEKG